MKNAEYYASKWIEINNSCMITKILDKGEIQYIKVCFSPGVCGLCPLPKNEVGE